MGKVYDSIILLLLILVFIGFVWLQKTESTSVSPLNYLEKQKQKQGFQNQASPGSPAAAPIPLPTRTLEINAAKKSICNLQNVFDNLQCSAYLVANPNRPTTSAVSTLVVPPPTVAVTANIDNLSNFAIVNGDLSSFIKVNDMIYFGHTLDMQGPFIVKTLSFTSPIPSEKSIFAGDGTIGRVDGTGIQAAFNSPQGIAIDSAGNIYVADEYLIRMVTPAGVVSTFVGTGAYGSADGIGESASFNRISGLSIDSARNLYAADLLNNKIRKITPQGVVTTITGTNFSLPYGITVDSAGTIYTVDCYHHQIAMTTSAGVTTVFAGSGQIGAADGAAATATFNYPGAAAIHPITGDIYVGDVGSNKIRRINGGQVTTYAGTGVSGSEDGSKLSATFNRPYGLAFDSAGNLYVADQGNGKVRRITVSGNVDTIASSIPWCSFLAFDTIGNLFVTGTSEHRIYKIPASTILTFTTKYVGPNLRNSVLAMVSSSANPSVSSGTLPVVELSGADEVKKEVYIFNTKLDYTLTSAQTACASFNGQVATLEQMKQANRQGADTPLFTLVKDTGGAAISAVSVQTANTYASLPVGVNTQPSSSNNSALACYGVKPPEGTSIGSSIIQPFSSNPPLYNNPHVITGYVDAGTNYITTTNDVLPENLKIGEAIYIQGRCNRYDTDNGDGTCTAYLCNLGETDLLKDNKCQRYACRDGDTDMGDGTCRTAEKFSPGLNNAENMFPELINERGWAAPSAVIQQNYNPAIDSFSYRVSTEFIDYCQTQQGNQSVMCPRIDPSRGVYSFNIKRAKYQNSYSYDIIKSGIKSTQYEKTTANPRYNYKKVLGPYIVAANPAVGKILLKSKNPGDFDASGQFMSISSSVTDIRNKVPASFGLQNVVINKVDPIDTIIMNLVKKGTIKNYDQCIGNATVLDLASKNKMAGDDSGLNTTRYTMCTSYYKLGWWQNGALGATDDRKDEYKTGRGVALTKKLLGCPAGTFSDEISCVKCPAGQSSVVGGKCTNCPSGQSSVEGGQCTNCPVGQTSVPGDQCVACPVAGQVCVCPFGQSSLPGGSCTACPSGYTCPGKQTNPYRYRCPTGTLSGRQCLNAEGPPYSCPIPNALELYKGLFTQAEVTSNGYTSLGNADSLGQMCIYEIMALGPGGRRSTNTFRSQRPIFTPSNIDTIKEYLYCPNERSSLSAASCPACPAGQSSEGGGPCANCPAGKTSVAGGLCRICPAGQSSVAGGQCANCPAGQSSVAGGQCTNCLAGEESGGGGPCTPCRAFNETSVAGGICQCAPGKGLTSYVNYNNGATVFVCM